MSPGDARPLAGITVIEFAGLAPTPFASLILSDFGASVIRVDRYTPVEAPVARDFLTRDKRSISVNLKHPDGVDTVKRLIRRADVLIDPYRPGVLEKAGLGPDVWLGSNGQPGENENLVFARVAGFQRDGPHSNMAGHDINYIALSGVLSLFPGSPDKPTFPLNLLADFAGGGLTCALGVLLALFDRQRTGRGQVVDADMVSGTRYLATYPLIHASLQSHLFASPGSPRQSNLLDGGAPFYNVYTCADGLHVAVGCLEPQFFRTFLEGFLKSVSPAWLAAQAYVPNLGSRTAKKEWPTFRDFLEEGFRLKPRDEWAAIFHGVDACVTPVLDPSEAAALASSVDPHIPTKSNTSGIPSPSPALSRTPASTIRDPVSLLTPGQDSRVILLEADFTPDEIARLVEGGVVGVASIAEMSKL